MRVTIFWMSQVNDSYYQNSATPATAQSNQIHHLERTVCSAPQAHSPSERAERAPGLALTSPNARAQRERRLPAAAGAARGARVRARGTGAAGGAGRVGRTGRRGSAGEPRQQRGPVRRAEPGAGIPARAGLVGAVAAVGDVAEARHVRARGDPAVQQWLQQPEAGAAGLREPRDQAGPE